MIVSRAKKFREKPSGLLRLDWSNPLLRNPVHICYYNEGAGGAARELVTQKDYDFVGPLAWQDNGLNFDDSAIAKYVNFGTEPLPASNKFTFFIVFQRNVLTALDKNYSLFSQWVAGPIFPGGQCFSLYIAKSTSNVGFALNTATQGALFLEGSTANSGQKYLLVGCFDGTQTKLYVSELGSKSIAVASSTISNSNIAAVTQDLIAGESLSDRQTDRTTYATGILNTVWSEDEVNRFSRDYLQLLKSRRRKISISDAAHQLIAESAHASANAESIAVTQQHLLSVADSAASSQAAVIAIQQEHTLALVVAESSAQAESVNITQEHLLAFSDAIAQALADSVEINQTQEITLVLENAYAAAVADTIAIEQAQVLLLDDVVADAISDEIGVSQDHVLILENAAAQAVADIIDTLAKGLGVIEHPGIKLISKIRTIRVLH